MPIVPSQPALSSSRLFFLGSFFPALSSHLCLLASVLRALSFWLYGIGSALSIFFHPLGYVVLALIFQPCLLVYAFSSLPKNSDVFSSLFVFSDLSYRLCLLGSSVFGIVFSALFCQLYSWLFVLGRVFSMPPLRPYLALPNIYSLATPIPTT